MIFLVGTDIRVEMENIGEGKIGDFDPDDPTDENFLRFYISERKNGNWIEIEDASYCTLIPADTEREILSKLLTLILDRVSSAIKSGDSVKKLCEELSWIEPSWVKEK